jgi:hypothetical protein
MGGKYLKQIKTVKDNTNIKTKLSMVAYAYNPSTQESEAGRL